MGQNRQTIRRKRQAARKRRRVLLVVIIALLLTAGVVLAVLAVTGHLGTDRPSAESSSDSMPSGESVPDTTTSGQSGSTSSGTKGTTTSAPTKTTSAANPAGHYVQPAGSPWYLKLANDWNTLPSNYEDGMTLVPYSSSATREVDHFDSRAIEQLRAMIQAGNRENPALDLRPVSCFRSAATQTRLFNNQVAKMKRNYPNLTQAQAEAKAATVVKRPGQSEHNTGLAADLGGSGDYSLEQSFENTKAFAWLKANCAKYGFILRFPKDKEEITGVIYEPWHYRYVGVEAAQEIMSRGICLEEYLEEKGL